jgi:hypothetical protein
MDFSSRVKQGRMGKRFRIAFSFAGQKRDFVASVASILADRFGEDRVLYDRYHEAEFAHSDLALRLPALYHEADLVVAVLCKEYELKEWCGLEWRAIYSLIKEHKSKDVMLTRFDRVDGTGLFGLAGFVELDAKTPMESATLILERLALNEGHSKDHYAQNASGAHDWPEVAPALDWPVADHREAQRAFAQLITRSTKFRLLPIHGLSETGKSHLTKQFLRNCLGITALTCGRFDFKGSADMTSELNAFAERLEVPLPTPGVVSSQLSQILSSLKKAARPTVLIFDTFELAGDADRWVRENLLLSIGRASWLRVIVVGQRTTQPHGEPWATFSAKPIELRSPSPQEWFDYGQPHKPGITLEFVEKAHECCGGKSTVLAQLLGPTS